MRGPEPAGELVVVGRGQLGDGGDAELAEAGGRARPDARDRGHRLGAHRREPRAPGEAGDARRAWRSRWPSWPGASSRRCRPRSAAGSGSSTVAWTRRAKRLRVGGADAEAASSHPHSSTGTPSDRRAAITCCRGRVVGGVVRRQEHGVRAPRSAVRSGMPGAHPERPGLVGRRRHHLAGPGRVAVAADDHRPAGQLGPAQDLDGGEELVEVDVQDPVLRGRLLGRRRPPLGHRASLRGAHQHRPGLSVRRRARGAARRRPRPGRCRWRSRCSRLHAARAAGDRRVDADDLPAALTSGPPELPELMAASVWIRPLRVPDSVPIERSRALRRSPR